MRLAWGAIALCVWLVGCASVPPPVDLTGDPQTETIWVIGRGWHTEIGVEAGAIDPALSDVRAEFPGVRVLVFGFGERAYLLHREHDFGDMLAALVPGPGAILVTALRPRTPLGDRFPNANWGACIPSWQIHSSTSKTARTTQSRTVPIPAVCFTVRPEPIVLPTRATPGPRRDCNPRACPSTPMVYYSPAA